MMKKFTFNSGIIFYNYIDNKSPNYSTEGSSASITSDPIGNTDSISSEGVVSANTSQLFWLVDHDGDGKIGTNYYLGNYFKITADNSSVALKIDYFYIDSSGAYKVDRFGCYTGMDSSFVGFNFDCSNNIDTTGKKSLLVSVTPLGASTKITIVGDSTFPSQGEEITAASSTDNGVKTQIKTRYIYQFPSFMLDAITAKGTVE